jgi:hypothetical protein
MAKKSNGPKSGLEKIPPFLTRPLWKDPFVWIAIATALGWAVFLWWLLY